MFFEENLTCGLENNMRNLANFYQNTWKCQIWDFDGILLPKVENAWVKNLQGSYVCGGIAKYEEELCVKRN